MTERPTAVTALAIITAVLSASALFFIPASVLIVVYMPGPTQSIVRENDFFRLWIFLGSAIGWVACISAIAASGGIWYLKEWGRLLMLAYAVYAFLANVAGTLVTLFILIPGLMAYDGPERAGALGGAAGGLAGGFFGLILPAAQLYILTRPHIREAFQAAR